MTLSRLESWNESLFHAICSFFSYKNENLLPFGWNSVQQSTLFSLRCQLKLIDSYYVLNWVKNLRDVNQFVPFDCDGWSDYFRRLFNLVVFDNKYFVHIIIKTHLIYYVPTYWSANTLCISSASASTAIINPFHLFHGQCTFNESLSSD